jgi:hypothetical protein
MKNRKKRNINWQKGISIFVLCTLIIAAVSTVIIMSFAPSEPDPAQPHTRLRSDYVLMLLQCIIGIFAMLLPSILKKRMNLVIPSNMMLLFTIFLYCAIYLGEVKSFYYQVSHWDTILHTFSGAMLGALGFSFVTFLNKTERVPLNLSPLFVAAFAFCFAVMLGVVWEIYEFTADSLLATNMQKFALESGQPLVGREALSDTMKDLIVDMIGAFVMSAIGYISLKYKKGWVEKLLLKIKK